MLGNPTCCLSRWGFQLETVFVPLQCASHVAVGAGRTAAQLRVSVLWSSSSVQRQAAACMRHSLHGPIGTCGTIIADGSVDCGVTTACSSMLVGASSYNSNDRDVSYSRSTQQTFGCLDVGTRVKCPQYKVPV